MIRQSQHADHDDRAEDPPHPVARGRFRRGPAVGTAVAVHRRWRWWYTAWWWAVGLSVAGPLVVHGPRSKLPGSDTAAWVAALRRLEVLGAKHVVPGFGSWGGPEQIVRQRRFSRGAATSSRLPDFSGPAPPDLLEQIRIPSDDLVWMPYDNPAAEDIDMCTMR